ncbi:hypothetical protein RFI_01210, partial [Reticulomyxa filosa]
MIQGDLIFFVVVVQLRRKLQLKKHQHIVNSINLLHEWNIRNLFMASKRFDEMIAISRPLKLDDIHQSDITKEEVIDAMKHLSPYKAQGPDNIHNQMLKNGGNAIIGSLIFLFGWDMPIAWKRQTLPIALLSNFDKLMDL